MNTHVCFLQLIYFKYIAGERAGHSPGYSLSLVAETTSGVLLSVERTAASRHQQQQQQHIQQQQQHHMQLQGSGAGTAWTGGAG